MPDPTPGSPRIPAPKRGEGPAFRRGAWPRLGGGNRPGLEGAGWGDSFPRAAEGATAAVLRLFPAVSRPDSAIPPRPAPKGPAPPPKGPAPPSQGPALPAAAWAVSPPRLGPAPASPSLDSREPRWPLFATRRAQPALVLAGVGWSVKLMPAPPSPHPFRRVRLCERRLRRAETEGPSPALLHPRRAVFCMST